MTETQATSGTTGTSMNPTERGTDEESSGSVDRSAVGRASVPVEAATKAKNDKGGLADRTDTTSTAGKLPPTQPPVPTSVLYLAIDQMHVFTDVNKALVTFLPNGGKNLKITAGMVIGGAGAIGLVLVVLITALSTLGAFVYNVCADLVGGIEVTLSE